MDSPDMQMTRRRREEPEEEFSDTQFVRKSFGFLAGKLGSKNFMTTILVMAMLGVPSARDFIMPPRKYATQEDVESIKAEVHVVRLELDSMRKTVEWDTQRLDRRRPYGTKGNDWTNQFSATQ